MNISNTTQIPNYLRNKVKLFFRSVPQTAYFVASLAAFAAINYTIIHSPIVLIATFLLMVHELAHYYYAKSFGANPTKPIVLPLPFIAIAYVRVKDLLDIHKPHVAISGMIFGSLFIFILSLFNYFIHIIPFYMLFIMFILELVFNIFGLDGSKYRRYKKKFNYV